MRLTSPVFSDGGRIPKKYTCDGEDVSPPLVISDVPAGTASLVLIVDDPDAPMGVWDHWIVFNIPPDTREIVEGSEPEGTHGRGTGGNTSYLGPCPPDREHRYCFKLFALDTRLDVPEGSKKREVESSMERHILARTEFVGRYERRK